MNNREWNQLQDQSPSLHLQMPLPKDLTKPTATTPLEVKKPPEGTKFDQGKAPLSLIPARAQLEEAYVWGMGEKKYGRYNWQGGISFSRILDSLLRHATAYTSGQTLDPESGRSHMAHIRCNAAMLIEFEATRPDLDDRQKS